MTGKIHRSFRTTTATKFSWPIRCDLGGGAALCASEGRGVLERFRDPAINRCTDICPGRVRGPAPQLLWIFVRAELLGLVQLPARSPARTSLVCRRRDATLGIRAAKVANLGQSRDFLSGFVAQQRQPERLSR